MSLRLLRQFNTDSNGTRHTPLPCDEAQALQRLHHLVDTGRRDKEVTFNIRFGRRSAKAGDVLLNEGKVFELSLRWLPRVSGPWRRFRSRRRNMEFHRACVDCKSSATCEVDNQLPRFVDGDMRHLLAL